MKQRISVTHHRSGRIDICSDGQHRACLDDESDIGATLAGLGVEPDDQVNVQTVGGRDWQVAARSYLKESTRAT